VGIRPLYTFSIYIGLRIESQEIRVSTPGVFEIPDPGRAFSTSWLDRMFSISLRRAFSAVYPDRMFSVSILQAFSASYPDRVFSVSLRWAFTAFWAGCLILFAKKFLFILFWPERFNDHNVSHNRISYQISLIRE